MRLLMASFALATTPAFAEDMPIPSLEESTQQIESSDAALFRAAFEDCDPAKLLDLLAEDYRMIHDLGGLVAADRAAFVGNLEQQCAAREAGGANEGYKNRRQVVPGSRSVTPLGQWGVLERGWHTFHEWRGEKMGWVQVGGARYIHVWRWMPSEGKFRLQESISVDHG
jgi:hypothetical protein